MSTTTLKIQSLPLSSTKTYLTAALFIVGNIVLPQLFHLIPQGGITWLPIYFFTLVGAYRYGMNVGLLTATLSPVINSVLFGMPAAAVLPAILIKSVILAIAASLVARRTGKVTLAALLAVVLSYQLTGTAAEWILCGSFVQACQDLRIGLPGMLLQILGGYAVIKKI